MCYAHFFSSLSISYKVGAIRTILVHGMFPKLGIPVSAGSAVVDWHSVRQIAGEASEVSTRVTCYGKSLQKLHGGLAGVRRIFHTFLILPYDTLPAEALVSSPPHNADVAWVLRWRRGGAGGRSSSTSRGTGAHPVVNTGAHLNVQMQNNCDGQ